MKSFMVKEALRKLLLKRPFFLPAVPYIIGLSVEKYFHFRISLYYFLLAVVSSLILLLRRDKAAASVVLFSVSFVFLGLWQTDRFLDPQIPAEDLSRIADGRKVILEGKIYRFPERSLSGERLYVKVERVFKDGRPEVVSGKMLLTIGDNPGDYSFGERVRFRAKIKRPRNFGNPGGFDYEGYLYSQGIYVTGFASDSGWVTPVRYINTADTRGYGGLRSTFFSYIGALRSKANSFIERNTEDETVKGILKALVLGDKGEVAKKTRDVFIKTGTAHLLAISGLHIGIIAFISYMMILGLLKSSEYLMLYLNIKRTATFMSIIPVTLYAFMAGFSIPTQRALVFVIVFFVAIVIDRERDNYNILAFAAFVILLFKPLSLFQPSFQLSFAAVASILLFIPILETGTRVLDTGSGRFFYPVFMRFIFWIKNMFLVSLITLAALAPLLLYHFHRFSFAGLFTNIFTIPIIGFIALPLLLSSVFLSFISLSPALPMLKLASLVLGCIFRFLSILSRPSWMSIYLSTPSLFNIVFYYLCLISFCFFKTKSGKGFRAASVFSLTLAVYLVLPFSFLSSPYKDALRVTFISVGQGDSALVEFPGNKNMLIDGGGSYSDEFDVGERIIAPVLWKKQIRRVDYVVLSHPQADHFKGLKFIIDNFSVKRFWWNGDTSDSPEFTELMEGMERNGVKKTVVNSSMPPVTINGVRLKILNPPKRPALDTNNRSMVLRLNFGRVSLLFTGDIEREAERYLIGSGLELSSDILKVPHHGSSTSSTLAFLKKIRPKLAVLSAGYMNGFGFPHKAVVKRYKALNIPLLRTDRCGAISVVTDGNGFQVETYRQACIAGLSPHHIGILDEN